MITIREHFNGVKKGSRFGFIKVLGKPFRAGGSEYLVVVKCTVCKSIYTILARRFTSKNPPSRCNDCARKVGTHGGTKTKLHKVWISMKSRCLCPTDAVYKDYGGRGITVSKSWQKDFSVFRDWALANGYAEGLHLDRIDNNRGYYPKNCRWVTCKENNRNKRTNLFITAFGETKCMIEWSEDKRCKVTYMVLGNRIRKGWTPEKAMTHPQVISNIKTKKEK